MYCWHQRGVVYRSRAARRGRISRLEGYPWLIVLVWTIFVLSLTPVALGYTHSVDYAGASATLSGTESAKAQALLSTVGSSHSTLLVVVDQSGLSADEVRNDSLAFQAALSARSVPYVNSSESVYSSYAGYLDATFGPEVPVVRSLDRSVTNVTLEVYGFPAHFLTVWLGLGGTHAAINQSYAEAGGSGSGYDTGVRDWLLQNDTGSASPAAAVQSAVESTVPRFWPLNATLDLALNSTNVTAYTTAVPALVDRLLSASGGPTVPESWIVAAVLPGDFGTNYVAEYGLSGVPGFIRSQFVSPDRAVSLILVTFTVPDSYRTPAGTYPAQAATPTVRAIASAAFGPTALVTGAGAVAYDTQVVESGSGALFALTFLFLGIAVALTLRSWIAPLLALVLISMATIVGYLAIELTGLYVGKVDFTVTYTLTAVTLGVATDYALFFLYRYREELTRGQPPEAALRTASRSSRFAILVSATTVAVGLGTLSFLSGLRTWGPVLFVTILSIGLLEVTLLPALTRLIGPRIFVRRWLRPAGSPERSPFYRAAAGSGSRAVLVGTMAAAIAVPAVLGFLIVPTSYNFAGGVPSATPGAQGQQLLEEHFGANVLYPIYVVVPASTSFVEPNGSLTPEADRVLPADAADLLDRPGVSTVEGPFVSGTNLSTPASGTGGTSLYLLNAGRDAYYVVYSTYGPYSNGALSLVASLRADPNYVVGGVTSGVVDERALDSTQYPVLEILLTLFIAVILGIAFRSLWIPLISVSGVFLSIATTTSVLYLISVYLLHAPLLWLIPLILFVILMSLGNDYTVFLLTRVREEQAQHGPFEGIRRGIAGSGVVVSALGLILAASLGSLALQPISFLQEVGIAFVISLVLDTFVVRPFYFPAMLTLLERYRARGPAGGADGPARSAAP